jgi:hypothetical protein
LESVETLSSPFATWQEGLLRLAAALGDASLEKIIVARLEATAAKNGTNLRNICALALLVPSRARFDPQSLPKWEPHPHAVALAAKVSPATQKHLQEALDAHGRLDQLREEHVFSAFSEHDPRRLFKDTTLAFSAAALADLSHRLGDADPFSRLAFRMSLWFKPWLDFSRYGIRQPGDGSVIVGAVRRAIEPFNDQHGLRIRRLIRIWAGDDSIEADEHGIRGIRSLISPFDGPDIGGLDGVLALEIFGTLADNFDSLDVDTLNAISETLKWLPRALDDGRTGTSDVRAWIETSFEGRNGFRLAYDPSQAFEAATYGDNADALEPLLKASLEAMIQSSHASFAGGPLPIRGTIFKRDGAMFATLDELAPEATDLLRLLGIDGDYSDSNGPLAPQWYWTGEGNPDAITLPEAIDRARERGDLALCDMLIGCWLLDCTLVHRVPLPDVVGLAQRINALPPDCRSSTYAVLGLLKREAAEMPRAHRDVDALLSWLPLIDTAPPEDFDAYLGNVFSAALWSKVSKEEQRRLCEAEQLFVEVRRLSQQAREQERLRSLVVDWSAVAESFLRRFLSMLKGQFESHHPLQPLGSLIVEARAALKGITGKETRQMYMARHGLNILEELNRINTKGGKHLGSSVTWEKVVYVHAGLYWTLRAVLDVANNPAPHAQK